MKYAVTTLSPVGYAHSQAFREVAESLFIGLSSLGHDVVLTADLSLPHRRHIVLGCNLAPRLGVALPEDAILYNLEQVQVGSPWMDEGLLALFRQHTVWDYSEENLTQLGRLGVKDVRLLPVGYVPELTRFPRVKEELDVLLVGSQNDRRRAVIEALKARGFRAEAAFNVYGPERDRLCASARILLNVHFYEAKVFEIVRVSYYLANRRFVVSERGVDERVERWFAEGVAFADYDALVDTCARYLGAPDERARIARRGFELIAGRNQAALLEPLVGVARSKTAA